MRLITAWIRVWYGRALYRALEIERAERATHDHNMALAELGLKPDRT